MAWGRTAPTPPGGGRTHPEQFPPLSHRRFTEGSITSVFFRRLRSEESVGFQGFGGSTPVSRSAGRIKPKMGYNVFAKNRTFPGASQDCPPRRGTAGLALPAALSGCAGAAECRSRQQHGLSDFGEGKESVDFGSKYKIKQNQSFVQFRGTKKDQCWHRPSKNIF